MAEQGNGTEPRILLVGDITLAFVSAGSAEKSNIRRSAPMDDAVALASKEDFELVAVVMSGSAANLESYLKKFRRLSGKPKILLLAQMYHEPLAMKFVRDDKQGERLADDYLICPITADDLENWLRPKTGGEASAEQDARVAWKVRQLEKLATEDDLTGLKNRRYIWEFGRQIIARAQNTSGMVTLLVFDIDDFKHYNDNYGHPAGDDILKQAAVLIKRCCRRHDVVSRIGGDEFAVLFWDDPQQRKSTEAERRASSHHPTEAVFISERLREQLENAEFGLLGPDGRGVLTISGGLASFPRNGSTIEELFHKADQALLEAKESGKNRIYLVGRPNPR